MLKLTLQKELNGGKIVLKYEVTLFKSPFPMKKNASTCMLKKE